MQRRQTSLFDTCVNKMYMLPLGLFDFLEKVQEVNLKPWYELIKYW